jgi:hypothetical protein
VLDRPSEGAADLLAGAGEELDQGSVGAHRRPDLRVVGVTLELGDDVGHGTPREVRQQARQQRVVLLAQ